MSDYGMRAAAALNLILPGQHRDKTVARMFDVSVRMAQYLRAGQFWTIDRLSQASTVLGAPFDIALSPVANDQHFAGLEEIEEIKRRLDRLEEQGHASLVGGNFKGLAPETSASALADSGDVSLANRRADIGRELP